MKKIVFFDESLNPVDELIIGQNVQVFPDAVTWENNGSVKGFARDWIVVEEVAVKEEITLEEVLAFHRQLHMAILFEDYKKAKDEVLMDLTGSITEDPDQTLQLKKQQLLDAQTVADIKQITWIS